ncbi:MAG: hypothetical protein SFV24_05395 [Gemmatimonadales bacterium]|nr:hypothetical protein [Gemmatimonadales bacterium]
MASTTTARAQIDYRNLDDDRPTLIEDAYPVERFAFELLAPWRFGRNSAGSTHAFIPEVAYGFLRNGQVGLKLPIAGVSGGDDRTWGLAGLRLFTLYNFNTESRLAPALSLRADVTFPVGRLGGAGTRVSAKAIATRSWGRNRLHLNAAYTVGPDDRLAATEAAAKWWYGAAVDRTLYRQSILLVAEVYALRPAGSEPTQVNTSIGLRYQMTPYLVFDTGLARRLRRVAGPDYELTVGFSRALAFPALLPTGRSPAGAKR